ncbi:MAG: GAF domain-containing protein [Anaerolineales bacterium]|nr:GAF domain-containing protein [Anaerolineales bacterium]
MNRLFSSLFAHKRSDGRQFMFVIASAQIVALIGAIPGCLSVVFNAEFNDAQLRALSGVMPTLFLLSVASALYISWRMTPSTRKRLDEIANGKTVPDVRAEYDAWREATRFTVRFGFFAGIVFLALDVLPAILLVTIQGSPISSPVLPASLPSPIPAYILMGGLAAVLGWAILFVLLTERFTRPVRLVLVPSDFETQLKGRAGALVIGKFLTLIIALITISVLLIAPIGYQQTVRILYAEVNSLDALGDLRGQTILFSALALALGVGYSYYVSRSVSDPIHELIAAFNKAEHGDLAVRAPVSATDELGIVAMHFNRTIARLESLQNTMEQQVAERTKLLEVSNEVGRVASSSLDPDELIARVINLFTEQFGYYFAAIYLIDPSEKWADIREATGEIGKLLKQNRQRHEISSRSMVGSAIREKSAKIAQIASEEKVRYQNPMLPHTRSEIALPLLAGDRVLGALDVQSIKESDFTPDVIRTMQSMANHIAIALENASLYQEAQQNIREMRTIQQQYLLSGWSGISNSSEELEYGVGDEPDENAKKIEIPISLRDQILGEIRIENPETWTPEQENLVNAVATQAAVALENARLVNESRQTALRERMLAEINSKIWSSVTIDGILQTAAKELGRRLDASRATVELKIEGDS